MIVRNNLHCIIQSYILEIRMNNHAWFEGLLFLLLSPFASLILFIPQECGIWPIIRIPWLLVAPEVPPQITSPVKTGCQGYIESINLQRSSYLYLKQDYPEIYILKTSNMLQNWIMCMTIFCIQGTDGPEYFANRWDDLLAGQFHCEFGSFHILHSASHNATFRNLVARFNITVIWKVFPLNKT